LSKALQQYLIIVAIAEQDEERIIFITHKLRTQRTCDVNSEAQLKFIFTHTIIILLKKLIFDL
jgi:hypothetical protein